MKGWSNFNDVTFPSGHITRNLLFPNVVSIEFFTIRPTLLKFFQPVQMSNYRGPQIISFDQNMFTLNDFFKYGNRNKSLLNFIIVYTHMWGLEFACRKNSPVGRVLPSWSIAVVLTSYHYCWTSIRSWYNNPIDGFSIVIDADYTVCILKWVPKNVLADRSTLAFFETDLSGNLPFWMPPSCSPVSCNKSVLHPYYWKSVRTHPKCNCGISNTLYKLTIVCVCR